MNHIENNLRISEIEIRLQTLEQEKADLIKELKRSLSTKSNGFQPANYCNNKTLLEHSSKKQEKIYGLAASSSVPVTKEEKIELFLKLFRCRESVYPKLWENKLKGIKGYSPACKNEWVSEICQKPKTKCLECPKQAFLPLDETAALNHLKGIETIGTYAILEDNTCTFLASDFDGKGWVSDIFVYKQIAAEMGIEVLIERSRSGQGGHAWIFFSEKIPARTARILGTIILLKCEEKNHNMNFNSYDRFFPNQDFLPNGGFGNLIALPLQKWPREKGNSVFIDETLKPIDDQWNLLANVKRLSLKDVLEIVFIFTPYENN